MSVRRTGLLASLALAGCGSRHPPCPQAPLAARPAAPSVRVDTVVVRPPIPDCPPPPRCPPPPDPRLRGLPAGVDTSLWIALDSLSESDYLSRGGILGAWVSRLGDTAPVWCRAADTRLLPASTQKLLTTSAAMSVLGASFRWRTSLWMTGTVQNGILHGDLLIEGGGDPTLGAPESGPAGFANMVRKAGIQRVHGNIVALDTLIGRGQDAWPAGWTISTSKDDYGAPVLGLNWNQNHVGDRAIPEPRHLAPKSLRKALAARGIQVDGTDTTVRVRGDSIGSRKAWSRLGGISSPALEPIVRACLKESINPYAEAMLLAMGMGRAGAPRDAGRRRIQSWLASRGIDLERATVDDGSGLSRYDLITARQMGRLLRIGASDPSVRLPGLLPRGGEGTLRHRVRNFPDPRLLSAKTGTLDGVANLAGYLERPGRDTLVFAFLCNGFSGSPGPVRLFQDRLLGLLLGLPLHPPLPTIAPDTSRALRADSTATGNRAAPPAAREAKPDTASRQIPSPADTASPAGRAAPASEAGTAAVQAPQPDRNPSVPTTEDDSPQDSEDDEAP